MSIAEERNIDEITSRTNNLVREFWNISDLKLFKNGENVTYTAMLNGHKVYVRITENSRRTIEQIIAELEWVQSISESGLVVAHPIRDTNKLLLNSFELENEIFHLAVFTNADGEEPANSDLDNTFIAQQLGLTIGKLHHHSSPNPDKFLGRHKWLENIHVVEAEKTINHFHPPFIKEWRLCFEWWNDLAQNHSLSLVHMDAHTGNFNINNSGQVCLFDFDDCAWNFLSYDLAVAILGLFRLTKEQDEKNKLKASFIASYLSEYQLEQIWVDRIDSFRRLRAIEMLAWYLRMYGIKEDKKAGEIEYFEKLFSESPALI